MPIKSLNTGITSSNKTEEEKVVNKRAADPFDRLIFEKGLRVKQIMIDKNLNTMLILLNNGKALQVPVNYFARLKNATQNDLNKWELTGNGTGIRWKTIDEDLSLKGLIKESALISVLHRLEGKKDIEELTVL
jgi:hypothetical protein